MSSVRERRARVLLSEGSSLTAREHVTVLGRAGVHIEVMSSDPREAPLALAPAGAFARVQSKIAFARLLDELGAPQPRWWPVGGDGAVLHDVPYPYFLKAAFSTAGQGVRAVRGPSDRRLALATLRAGGHELIAQAPAAGQYGQVQALFEHGRMAAAHTSVQAGTGVGGSAAARLSVDHPRARYWAAAVGAELCWHGGLTMDYFHDGGEPAFIECNPRTVEPANAAASGVNLPALSIALAAGRPLPARLVTGRAGVRTHATVALLLGRADQSPARRAVLQTLRGAAAGTGVFDGSTEVLTPVAHDPPSAVPLLIIAAALLTRPGSAPAIAGRTVAAYAVTEQTIARLADPEPAGSSG